MPVSFNSLSLKSIKRVKIVYSDGTYSIKNLKVCAGFFSRLKGMLFSRKAVLKDAYLIVPCDGIHTFFMAYPIDVVFLSEYGEIMYQSNVVPYRIRTVKKAYAVLEGARLLKSNNNVVHVDFLC